MNKEITLRDAKISDLKLLRYWDKQPHIIASKGDEDWEWETELLQAPEWRKQYIVSVNNHPIGFIQIIDPYKDDTHYWRGVPEGLRAIDIWIGDEQYTGKGYGTQMMQRAIDLCFAEPDVNTILVDPLSKNIRAHKFYQKLGFKFEEQRFFGDDDCAIHKLTREDYNY